MSNIFISLGTNIGSRNQNLVRARSLLLENEVSILAESQVLETEAWGIEDQPSFLNQVLKVDFADTYSGEREPYALLYICQKVEREMGKTMPDHPDYIKWGPRIIDIDILKFNDIESWDPELRLPHHTTKLEYIQGLIGEV